MILLDVIREWKVDLPPCVPDAIIRDGINRVRKVVENERERQSQKVRWSKASDIASEICDKCGLLDSGRKRPPDMSAAHPSFSARLLMFVRDKCSGNGAIVYKRAGINRRIYSRIISDNNARAEKETVMRFAIGLQLTQAEADVLMASAGYAFSESIPVDCAFLYCIENGVWRIGQVDEILASIRRPS